MGRPRIHADSSVLDNAEEHVEELIRHAPDGIPIVTGGMTGEEKKDNPTGKSRVWLCKVIENDLPYSKDVQVVSYASRAGAYRKEFRANTEVTLPEEAIHVLELAVITNERRVALDPGKSLRDMELLNPGMKLIQRGESYFLQEERPRFSVQRLKLVQG